MTITKSPGQSWGVGDLGIRHQGPARTVQVVVTLVRSRGLLNNVTNPAELGARHYWKTVKLPGAERETVSTVDLPLRSFPDLGAGEDVDVHVAIGPARPLSIVGPLGFNAWWSQVQEIEDQSDGDWHRDVYTIPDTRQQAQEELAALHGSPGFF